MSRDLMRVVVLLCIRPQRLYTKLRPNDTYLTLDKKDRVSLLIASNLDKSLFCPPSTFKAIAYTSFYNSFVSASFIHRRGTWYAALRLKVGLIRRIITLLKSYIQHYNCIRL